jgi:hypothetical protein
MPPHQGVWRHDRGDATQHLPPEPLGLGSQAATLIIVEPQTLSLELLLQHPVFLDQIGDHVLLMTIQPTSEAREQHLQRVMSALMLKS